MVHASECAVVIPCFNEAASIGQLIDDCLSYVSTVIVVDDGCTDDTAKVAILHGAVVIKHSRNMGKGWALRSGWKEASERNYKWVISLDGDGQHTPEDIPLFLNRMEPHISMLVGNRMLNPGSMPLVRRVINRFMTGCLSVLTCTLVLDSQCGFRMFNLKDLEGIHLCTSRFEIESEMIAAFLRQGLTLEYVEIKTIYNGGKSSINPLVDTFRWLRWCLGVHLSICDIFPHYHQKNEACNRHQSMSINPPESMPDNNQKSITRQFQLWHYLGKAARFVIVTAVFGWLYAWASPKCFPENHESGYVLGFVHGALMPMALPSLVMGKNVEIFAANNSGRYYKIAYICGINACGLVFFGSMFLSPKKAKKAT